MKKPFGKCGKKNIRISGCSVPNVRWMSLCMMETAIKLDMQGTIQQIIAVISTLMSAVMSRTYIFRKIQQAGWN